MKHELVCENNYQSASKDIIVVVHNQLEYVKQCIESVLANSTNSILHIWNNDSDKETTEYLQDVTNSFTATSVVTKPVTQCNENAGFIIPNNHLASGSSSEYIILLNSDTVVKPGWDKALIGYLQQHPEVAQVGYMGGLLDEDGRGLCPAFGSDIDYVMAWCTCIRRSTYEQYGLFDEEHYKFAYFEDADLSLRLKKVGHEIYALHLNYVDHYGNVTAKQVKTERDISGTYWDNQAFFASRWTTYLAGDRAAIKADTVVFCD